MSEIVTIGNALIDAFLHLKDANNHVTINKEAKVFSIDYGQKILLEACEFHVGGNAANVAVGLARLGFASSIMAEIGSDEFADKIIHTLHTEKVATSYLLHDESPTSFAMNLTFQGERTIFVQHHKRAHSFAIDKLKAKWVYLTSLGESWKHVYRDMILYARSHPEVAIVCNPGTKQFEEGRDIITELLPFCTIFIANKEECSRLLYGKDGHTKRYSPSDLLRELRTLTPNILVLTDGERGSYVLDKEGRLYHSDIMKTETIGKTGAGDAFSTGFLASYIEKGDIISAIKLGTANASSVVNKFGAQTGLIHKKELSVWKAKMEHLTISTHIL